MFLRQLAFKVSGVFVLVLLAATAADVPFNIMTFDWKAALTMSGSGAFLALLEGLAGKLTGDRDQASITR